MKKTTRKTKSVIEFEPIEFTTPIYGYPIYVYEGDTRLLLNHIKGILKDHDFSGIIENDYGNIIWSQDGSFYLLLREDVTIDVLIRVLLTISIKIMNLVNIKIEVENHNALAYLHTALIELIGDELNLYKHG